MSNLYTRSAVAMRQAYSLTDEPLQLLNNHNKKKKTETKKVANEEGLRRLERHRDQHGSKTKESCHRRGWTRDLLAEGIEPNPGPPLCSTCAGAHTRNSCKKALTDRLSQPEKDRSVVLCITGSVPTPNAATCERHAHGKANKPPSTSKQPASTSAAHKAARRRMASKDTYLCKNGTACTNPTHYHYRGILWEDFDDEEREERLDYPALDDERHVEESTPTSVPQDAGGDDEDPPLAGPSRITSAAMRKSVGATRGGGGPARNTPRIVTPNDFTGRASSPPIVNPDDLAGNVNLTRVVKPDDLAGSVNSPARPRATPPPREPAAEPASSGATPTDMHNPIVAHMGLPADAEIQTMHEQTGDTGLYEDGDDWTRFTNERIALLRNGAVPLPAAPAAAVAPEPVAPAAVAADHGPPAPEPVAPVAAAAVQGPLVQPDAAVAVAADPPPPAVAVVAYAPDLRQTCVYLTGSNSTEDRQLTIYQGACRLGRRVRRFLFFRKPTTRLRHDERPQKERALKTLHADQARPYWLFSAVWDNEEIRHDEDDEHFYDLIKLADYRFRSDVTVCDVVVRELVTLASALSVPVILADATPNTTYHGTLIHIANSSPLLALARAHHRGTTVFDDSVLCAWNQLAMSHLRRVPGKFTPKVDFGKVGGAGPMAR